MANNISVIGRLAADSEQKHTAGGQVVLEFRIADDVGFGDKKVTNWWRCAVWGKQAESKLVEYLKKGQQVVVFGEATMREWEDRDGAKRLSPEIRVTSVQLAGSKQESQSDAGSSQPAARQPASSAPKKSAPAADNWEDDIPF